VYYISCCKKSRLECSHKRYNLGCHVRSFCSIEIQHDCHNTELPCKMWIQHCMVNTSKDDKNCKWVEPQDHADWPHIFSRFLHVNKSAPTTSDQPTSLDSPDPMYVRMIGREEEDMEGTWPLSAWPARKVALTALSEPDSVICQSATQKETCKTYRKPDCCCYCSCNYIVLYF